MAENIFTELYNRVLSLFGQSTQKEENTKDVACNRLRVVLMQDRTNITPELLERMRKELVELLSKYVEMDKDALELNFEQEGEQMALMLSIPVVRAKNEEEIEEALKEADEKTASDDENSDDEELQASDDSAEESSDENSDEDVEEEKSTDDEAEKSDEESASEDEASQEDDESSSQEQEVSGVAKPAEKEAKKKNK